MHRSPRFGFIFILSFLLSFSFSPLFAEQTVYLRNGKVLKGEVIKQTPTVIIVRMPDGTEQEIKKTAILKVSFKELSAQDLKAEEEKAKKQKEEQEKASKLADEEKEKAAKLAEDEKKKAAAEEAKSKRAKEMEEAKRHYIQLLLGFGPGHYISGAPQYYDNIENVGTFLNDFSAGPLHTAPVRKGKFSRTIHLRYAWNRLVVETGGSYFESSTTSSYPGTLRLSDSPLVIQNTFTTGTYPEKYKQVYGQISYSVYPNKKFDIRPIVGIQRIITNTVDKNSVLLSPAAPGGFDLILRKDNSFSETMRGTSAGLAFEMKFAEKFEGRIEVLSYNLNASSRGERGDYSLNLSNGYRNKYGVSNDWKITGTSVNLRLLYQWKYGISFWAGISAATYQYKAVNTVAAFNDNSTPDPVVLLLQAKLINGLTQMVAPEAKVSALYFGAAYTFDFMKSNKTE
ncbi:hypothetical protein CH373_02490 [Leptospira perolatii]|uniref:Uncharacterized protein n=1 Tax=Leptospira perolatii TaxID=2023191 RepID=A0A2M9ZSH4_9LEPT|nr:hypothetical protein [Leptospira perolatii]PJZ71387.1 hypothetical protein CH360_02490 [Leptospira perolatii]PJZ74921.1 hypothetical protein CH373_02490 [Leptospira perolatii]